jgi:hypothetical protein
LIYNDSRTEQSTVVQERGNSVPNHR